MDANPLQPPAAGRRPLRIEQLGRTRTDDYAWMKDENWQRVLRDPAVLRDDIATHLRAENAYTAAMLAPTEALQATLLDEMKGRLKPDEMSPPLPDGDWEYYARYADGAEQPVYARRPRGGGNEQVLLDVDALAKPHDYFVVADAQHSNDHRLFAYAEDAQGSEVYRIRVLDLETGTLLDHAIESSTGDFTFSPCSRFLFWTFRDDNGRPTRIYRRPARGGDDELVYEEHDPGFFIGVGTTSSREWITLECGDQETTETWLIPASDPTAAPVLVAARDKGVRYSLSHWGDRFIIRTNLDGAVDFKLMQTPADAFSREHWRDLVPYRPGHYIVRERSFRDHLVYVERHEANNSIVIMRRDGDTHGIAIDEPAYLLSVDGSYEYDTTKLRTGYQSPTTPRQWFEYDMDTRERRLLKTQEIPSGHDPAQYRTRRLQAPAPDGTMVPVTVLMRHDTPEIGTAPLLLYGYGLVRPRDRAGVLHHRPRPGRSRLGVCHRPCPGWLGEGLGLVPGRARPAQAEQLHRLHRLRPASRRAAPCRPGAHRGAGRFGRRPADGCRRQPAPGSVCRRDRPGAVRRHAQHHVRRLAAADAAGMAGMGQPDHRRRSLRPHRRLLPVRQHPRGGLPRHPRARRPVGPPRDLLGAGQVGREAAAGHHRQPPDPAAVSTWKPATAAPPAATRGSRRPPWRRPSRSGVSAQPEGSTPAASRRSRRVPQGSPGTWAARHACAGRCRHS